MALTVEARDLQLGEVCKPFKEGHIEGGVLSGQPLPFGGRQIDIRAMNAFRGSLVSLGISTEKPLTPDEVRKLGQYKVNIVKGQERIEMEILPKNGALPQAQAPWSLDQLGDAEVIVYPRHQMGS